MRHNCWRPPTLLPVAHAAFHWPCWRDLNLAAIGAWLRYSAPVSEIHVLSSSITTEWLRGRNRVTKSGDRVYLDLFPLLELSWPVAERLIDAAELATPICKERLLTEALLAGGRWASLAVVWCVQGFPLTLKLSQVLRALRKDRTVSQTHRHQAFRLAVDFLRRTEDQGNTANADPLAKPTAAGESPDP